MISASKEFKEKLKNGKSPVVNYADITLSDGTVLHLTYKDFMIGGCQIEDKTTDGKFGVGYVIGKTLLIKLENQDERFSKYDFYNSIINLYVAMQLDNGNIEKIRKGVFYTVVPETPGDIIEISAVDGMYQLDKDYSSSTTAYPATLQSIISDACLDCGIPIGFRQFDNMNFTVQEKPAKATYRQIVSWAAQIAGYNAHIDNNGYMQFIWYDSALLDRYNYDGGNFKTYYSDTIIDGGNFTDYSADEIVDGGNFTDQFPERIFQVKSLNVSTDDVQITGVKVIGNENKTELFGEEGYLIEISGNSFVNGKEQEIAEYLGKRMSGMVFRPFSASILGNPLYEPFEVVMVSDRKGNIYNSIINSVSYKIGGYTQVACEAEDPVRNGSRYVSASAQAVAESRKNTEKQLTTYDKAVQNINNLASNMMGLFRGQEKQSDGSDIYYQSNKPITVDDNGKCHFEENSVVYKIGAEGFFVSTDGGKSFTSGFDAQGNAVVNVISAIGMTFDWAHGGTLSLGGDNNINGEMIVYNAGGDIVGKFNKDGLWAKNGYFEGTVKSQNAEITGGYINIETDSETNDKISLNYNHKFTNISPYGINISNMVMANSGGLSVYRGNTLIFKADTGLPVGVYADKLEVAGGANITGGINSQNQIKITSGGINIASGDIKTSSTSNAAIGNRLIVGSSAIPSTSDSTLSVQGDVAISKGIDVNGGITVSSGDLKMSSSIATFTSEGNAVLKKALDVSGNTTLKNTLNVSGNTVLSGDVEMKKSVKIAALTSSVGFFGSTGSGKKTIPNLVTYPEPSASKIADKLNDLLTALRAYGLIG